MEARVPVNFVPVPYDEFSELMAGLNIRRDGYCGGIYYHATDYGGRRVGVLLDDQNPVGCFIDPEFFPRMKT